MEEGIVSPPIGIRKKIKKTVLDRDLLMNTISGGIHINKSLNEDENEKSSVSLPDTSYYAST